MLTATVFTGASLAAIACITAASLIVAQRSWRVAVVVVVAADALTWSWLDGLKETGNIVYWGTAAGIGVSLLLQAMSSTLARRVLAAAVATTAVLSATAIWSFEPHATLREAATFGSALTIVGFAITRARGDEDGREGLARALGVIPLGALAATLLVILLAHGQAVAEGGGVSGFMNGPNSLGILVSISVGFLFVVPKVDRNLSLLAACVAVLAFVLTLSASRTGMLAAAAAFAVCEGGRRQWRKLTVGFAAALIAGTVAVVWVPNIATLGRPLVVPVKASASRKPPPAVATPSRRPVVPARDSQTSSTLQPKGPPQVTQIFGGRVHDQSRFSALVGARDEAWQEAVHLLGRRPLLGSGFGTGDEIFQHDHVRGHFRYFVGAFDSQANVHDAYLQALLEIGILGGLLFIMPAFLALASVGISWFQRCLAPSDAAFAAATVASAICSIFESMLAGFGAMTLLAWLSFAMVITTMAVRRSAPEASEAAEPNEPERTFHPLATRARAS